LSSKLRKGVLKRVRKFDCHRTVARERRMEKEKNCSGPEREGGREKKNFGRRHPFIRSKPKPMRQKDWKGGGVKDWEETGAQ